MSSLQENDANNVILQYRLITSEHDAPDHSTIHPSDVPLRRCTKCGEEKPATPEFFPRYRKNSVGLEARCKACRNAYVRAYNQRPEPKAWRQAYMQRPDIRPRVNAYNHNHRARKKGASGAHTAEQIQEQLKRQRCRCYYCKAKFEQRYVFDIDHTFPISRTTDSDIPTNDISYLVLACPTCNRKKHDKYPWEFEEGGKLL